MAQQDPDSPQLIRERERARDALRAWIAGHQFRLPDPQEWEGPPSRERIVALFGSWDVALLAARWDWPAERDEVIAAVRAYAERYGEAPSQTAWMPTRWGRVSDERRAEHERRWAEGAWPTRRAVMRHFPSGFTAAHEAAGLPPGKVRLWTREKVIAAIQRFAAEHGRPPRAVDFKSSPSASTVQGLFGSWTAGLRAAGFEPLPAKRKGPVWTQEKLIAALQSFAREHGRPPAYSDFACSRPAGSTIIAAFGSWSEAMRAAGFEPRPQGGPQPRRKRHGRRRR